MLVSKTALFAMLHLEPTTRSPLARQTKTNALPPIYTSWFFAVIDRSASKKSPDETA
jgi:hypothetical protein